MKRFLVGMAVVAPFRLCLGRETAVMTDGASRTPIASTPSRRQVIVAVTSSHTEETRCRVPPPHSSANTAARSCSMCPALTNMPATSDGSV
jgi:hypothetical protein